MNCRVCKSSLVSEAGTVEYYSGFDWTIFDCQHCGCRFTKHDPSIYELLHTESKSIPYYTGYRDFADRCKLLFEARDLDRLRAELFAVSKYRFIIEEVERGPRNVKLLEIGCSRGYLTSYFILAGYKIIGVDASLAALSGARAAFGERFVSMDSALIAEGAPYDIIYHVGTIGCVADPLKVTENLLGMLKPGGKLLFNAPNRHSLWLRGQLWIDAAAPPDLVTLFPPGFWHREFNAVADVYEEEEICAAERSVPLGLRKLFRRSWRKPVPISIGGDSISPPATDRLGDRLWSFFERAVRKAGRVTRLSRFAPKQPSEFGLFVKMIRK